MLYSTVKSQVLFVYFVHYSTTSGYMCTLQYDKLQCQGMCLYTLYSTVSMYVFLHFVHYSIISKYLYTFNNTVSRYVLYTTVKFQIMFVHFVHYNLGYMCTLQYDKVQSQGMSSYNCALQYSPKACVGSLLTLLYNLEAFVHFIHYFPVSRYEKVPFFYQYSHLPVVICPSHSVWVQNSFRYLDSLEVGL